MRSLIFLRSAFTVLMFFAFSVLQHAQAEDCYLANLKPGLWRTASENNIFLEQDRDFVVEPNGLTYWPDPIVVNIDVDMDCIYNGSPSGSKAGTISPVIKDEDMTCDDKMHFRDAGSKTRTWSGGSETTSWALDIEGSIVSDSHIAGEASEIERFRSADLALNSYSCQGSATEYWTADWTEEIGPPDAPSLIFYPATAKPGETIKISWASVPSIAKIYYVLERDKSASFENPIVLYSGKDTEISDSPGNFINSETYRYYYRVKAVTAFGVSEWKAGNAVSFIYPLEIIEIYNQTPLFHDHFGFHNFSYYRIYVPLGASSISVEDNIAGKYSHLIYLRHKYLPTESIYDAVKKEQNNIEPCTAQVDGKYGYWYIGLIAETTAGGGNITASMEVNHLPPQTLLAEFNGRPTKGTYPLTVNFTDQSTGLYTEQYWDFGDNDTSFDVNPTHTYTYPGIYSVRYMVSGPNGYDIENQEQLYYR